MGSRGEAEPLLGTIETKERQLVRKKGCLSSMLFMWMNPLLELGNTRPLEMTDLYELDPLLQTEGASGRFQACWAKELRRESPSLTRALICAFGMRFLAAGWLRLIRDILQFVGPFVIQKVIMYLTTPSADIYQGLYYVGVIFLAGNVQAFCFRNYMYFVFETGLLCKSAIVSAVYQKALRLSASARGSRSTGEITNLMAIDAQRIQDLLADLHAIWYGPCLIIASCACLYWQIGPACYGALSVILLAIPLSICISRRMRTLQKALMAVKDERIKLCYEVLSGIKVIKLQAWENHFISRVSIFRKDELAKLKSYILTRSLSNSIFNGVPALITVATFTCYTLLMNQIMDVTTALTSLSLFAIMRYPLFVLPSVLNAIVEASVSLHRLQSFLLESERSVVGPGSLTDIGIRMQDATFCWDSNVSEPALGPVSITAMDRGLIAVVGPVGSGKSTFLSGFLGDVQCTSGSVELKGTVAYVSQQPFIQNATVRDNICFGLPYEYGRYQAAIRVSCLEDDLRALPGNDLTEIGEKGINLSGGQRTRVALARAVYQDADIYLLDDILAAVDSHVGATMFEQCIQGTLKNKLVILVTNSLHLLQHCNRIIILQSSTVADIGTYSDLIIKPSLQTLIQSYIPPTNSDECIEDVVSDDEFGTTPGHQLLRVPSSEIIEKTRHLMTNEDRSVGDVAWPIYMVWIRACGGMFVGVCILLIFLIAQSSNILATFWLNHWASNDANLARPNRLDYIYIFVGLNLSYVVLIYLRVLLLYLVGLRGSSKLFDKLLYQVIRAPMVFFDTTPLGRIVNRLSKDVYAVDEDIPATYGNVLITLIGVGATILTIVFVTPWFTAILLPLGIGYIMCQRYFIKTSRELQRLESISRSPIYALMAETLDGLPTIRAYGVETAFIKRQSYLLDQNQRAYYLNFSANCWLGLRLEFAGSMIASCATLCAVLLHSPSSASFAGLAGVSLSYAFTVTPSLNMSVRYLSQLETQMVSVERMHTYTTMPIEPPLHIPLPADAPLGWPTHGEISFRCVDLRYRPGLPRVLRQFSVTIRAQEKIGVVGRTGAGKSSLVVALMRLVDIQSGSITLDGIDISTIGLHDLRQHIAIIPQDPVLFSGTIRFNLDPFQLHSDAELWHAIHRSQLSITSLDDPVDERGANLSLGERQLVCIARALLRRAKIIFMDEATASIDPNTDRLIQHAIRDAFASCTCLTIAHRLNTILDADRILVLDRGTAIEFDAPSALLKRRNSAFASLVSRQFSTK